MVKVKLTIRKIFFGPGQPAEKSSRSILFVILLNVFFFSFLLTASAATGIINTDYVNIRSGPATTYEVLGQLSQGSQVEITDSRNGWYQVKNSQLSGWVRNDLIDLQKEYSLVVTGNGVNLRSGPGTTYAPVGYANKGQTLTLLSTTGDWYQIKTADGLVAYISAAWAEKKEAKTTPPSNSNQPETPAVTTSQVEVVSGTVNLRSGPGSSYEKIGSVAAGDILAVLGKEGDWYEIKKADGSTAYIAGWLVRPTNAAVPIIPTAPAGNFSSPPKVILDGRQLTFDVPPIIENDRTLVPLRAIFEAMGATVNWDNNTRTVTAVKGSTTVVLTIGSTRPTVNGQVVPLDVPAKIKNDRTLAPLRFVGEAFGGQVDWDNTTRTITITSPTNSGATPTSVVIRDTTNLRSGPSTNEEILDQAQQGERLPILAQRDGWYQVSRGGRTAWIAGWVVDLAWEENDPLPPKDPVEEPEEEPEPEPPKKPEKPGPDVIWLSVDSNEKGLRINMDSGELLKADIKESSSKVTFTFADRKIEGLNLIKETLGSGQVKAKARNEGDDTVVEIEFPYGTKYQTASEAGGKREVFIIPNAITGIEHKRIGNMGDRLIIGTLTPAQYSSSKNGDVLEIKLPGVSLGKARNAYSYGSNSELIKKVTLDKMKGATEGILIQITTNGELGKYIVGQGSDGLNILLVGKGQIKSRNENLVVLDPGHGGSDTGARGNGVNEKDPNLKIALKVGRLLENRGIEVEYTRTADVYVELEERAAIANRLNAALFVSIHNNSVTDPTSQGTETYYYAPVSNDLLFLQLDERKALATNLQNQLVAKLKRPNRGVKTANFSVLRNTTMPSALVEVVFVSNPEEASLLQQDYFLNLVAEAIAEGIAKTMGK